MAAEANSRNYHFTSWVETAHTVWPWINLLRVSTSSITAKSWQKKAMKRSGKWLLRLLAEEEAKLAALDGKKVQG